MTNQGPARRRHFFFTQSGAVCRRRPLFGRRAKPITVLQAISVGLSAAMLLA